VSGLELGGLAGSVVAGRLSDWLISRAKGKGGNVGKRVQVVMAYTVGLMGGLATLQVCACVRVCVCVCARMCRYCIWYRATQIRGVNT
jgi:hypothetical protein